MAAFGQDFTLTVDGDTFAGTETADIINPATGTLVAQAPVIDRPGLDAAVAAARRAFPGWRATSLDQRREALRAFARVLTDHADAFARLFTLEQGRPLAGAKQEVLGSAFWFKLVAKQDIPVIVNEDSADRRSETHHVPMGVVAGIVPWNFPVSLAAWKIAPALLTGNCIIIKPSPFTPLTLLKLGELMREHLPPGVFSVVSGSDAVGQWLTEHPDIAKVSFTGSTPTGRRVMAGAAATLKRVTLELGGNDPAIVLADADPRAVAKALFWSAFGNSGQVCIATKRLYVHSAIYDAVAAELKGMADRVKVGDGLDPASALGPVQNRPQYERVKALIEDARAQGQGFITGGDLPPGEGYFIPATIVDNPPEDSRVVQEEAFGPVLPLLKFDDVEDAIARANESQYGLAASVWTADLDRGAAIAARIEAGTVWINECQYVMPWTPFGGHKQSGIGVEHGQDGLLAYTNRQTISVKKPAATA